MPGPNNIVCSYNLSLDCEYLAGQSALPIAQFTNSEPRIPSIYGFYVVRKRRSSDIEALKLGNVRSGVEVNMLSAFPEVIPASLLICSEPMPMALLAAGQDKIKYVLLLL